MHLMFKVAAAAINFAVACTVSSAISSATSDMDGRPLGLSMDEFNTLLITDIYEEFGAVSSSDKETAEALWNAANDLEWKQNKKAEADHHLRMKTKQQYLRSPKPDELSPYVEQTVSDGLDQISSEEKAFPYIVCDPEFKKSGNKAKTDIESHFGSNIIPIYNKDDKTCFYAYVPAAVAESAPKPLVVQSLLAEMKIGKGVVHEIKNDPPSKLEALLCPGVAGTKEESKKIGQSIIDSLRNKKDDSDNTLVSEKFLRMELFSGLDETKLNIDGHMNIKFLSFPSHDRFLVWRSAFDEGLNSEDQCEDMFEQIHVFGSRKGDSFVISFAGEGEESDSSIFSLSCLLSLVAGLAARNKICSVGTIQNAKELNVQAQWIVQSGNENERPWFDAGLTGKGQVVAVSDTGIDTDNCYFWDRSGDITKDGSVDSSRRKVVQYKPFADKTDFHGHGTHVAGTIAGRRAYNGRSESTGKADGVARDAEIAMIDLGNRGSLSIPSTADILMDPGKSAGAKIHNLSWGYPRINTYGFRENDFDDYIYDDEDFLVIIAAGNSGKSNGIDTKNSVQSPAISKNVIAVGASQSAGPDLDSDMKGKDYLAYFSSRGPSADGRTKPEVVAPGYWILSASANPSIVGTCDDTQGVKKLLGTSMSSPVVSGTAALIRQYFEEGWYPTGKPIQSDAMNPSGTLVKAVLLNGAQYLKGVQNGNRITQVSPYDNNQNFGRINMMNSLRLDGKNNMNIIAVDRKVINDGDTDTIDVTIDTSGGCSASELSATLVWMDPPGVPYCTQCVLNDLDLYAMKSGDPNRIYPNGLSERDSVNNSERVRVRANDGDKFTVYVKAHDLETSSQSYALVITGCFGNAPTPPPTTPPPSTPPPSTPSPTPVGPQKSLSTTFNGTKAANGNMFDIVANQDIIVSGMDINVVKTNAATVEIYTKTGTCVGFEKKSSSWTKIGSAQITSQGHGNPTPLPAGAFQSVHVSSGSTQAFYVTLTKGYLVYSKGTAVGKVAASNSDMKILEDSADIYPFGSNFSPRVWNGKLIYSVISSKDISQNMDNENGNMFAINVGEQN